ncbi:hypothetical protein [Xanthomonas arboricola]|uniref:hypothetical protein n=1 Tax=Xanthomonas arboricola TaxID=56448 RepID=UPI001EE8B262|nr:hypothetical protein [Xanthomonas arboricola]
MPSRSAHRAALRRSQEPGVIAPEGVTLPDLPIGMTWHNPIVGQNIDRDEWEVLRVGPGGADVLARIRRNQAGGADVWLTIAGSPVIPPPVTLPIAQAFEVAAMFAINGKSM